MQNLNELTMRPAQAEDAALVAELISELLLELDPQCGLELADMQLADSAASLLGAGHIRVYLAFMAGEPAGVISLHQCAALYAGGLFGEISELYVRPAYRSHNVGKLLVEQAARLAEQLGWQRLEVGTPPPQNSPRTLQFYQAQGFVTTGQRMRLLITAG